MQKAPLIVECEHQFNDIPSLHWLNQTLKKIAGTGALEAYKERYLLPDEPMNKSELKALSSQLINYFGSNMLISIFDGTNLFVRTKGALRDIQLVGWSYSLDGKSWEKLNTEGKISFKLAPTTALRISFKHPIFMESKPIVLEMSHPSLNLIKLKRNYANFTKDSFSGRVPVKAGYSNNARAKLKEKLAEIKRKRLEEQPHKRLTNAVPQKVEKSRVAIPIFTKKHTEKPLTKKEEKISKYNLAESSSESSRHLLEETSRIRASSEKNKEEEKELDEAVISETIPAIETATMEKKLSGKVINSITGKPISSAIVVFAGKHLITNQYGEFFYTGKHNQAFEITIYCEGYRPLRLKHRIRYRKEPLTIALKPTLLKFSGRVISLNSGIPVAKAVVKVGELNVRSSVDGTFTLSGLKPGYHQLSCFAEGFLDAHEIVYISKDKENTNFNLELKAIYDENIYFTESEISEVDPDEILRRTDPSVNQARWILKE
jgi:hypothetical protein